MQIEVPLGAVPGEPINITLQTGQIFTVTCPEGFTPGMILTANVPPALLPGYVPPGAPPPMRLEVEQPPPKPKPKPKPKSMNLRLVVPDGIAEGQMFNVKTGPDGPIIPVICPPGYSPGMELIWKVPGEEPKPKKPPKTAAPPKPPKTAAAPPDTKFNYTTTTTKQELMEVPMVGNKKAEAILAAADQVIAAKSFSVADGIGTGTISSNLCDWFTIDAEDEPTVVAPLPPKPAPSLQWHPPQNLQDNLQVNDRGWSAPPPNMSMAPTNPLLPPNMATHGLLPPNMSMAPMPNGLDLLTTATWPNGQPIEWKNWN